ncbi:MAG TPA: hypothetical protein VG435_20225 [Acidimicrobiales bacterium]|jgi:hypothetical protein|nr:hypothetical protein [Acidimicrobiales bacterium]
MFDSALREPSVLGGVAADRWRTNRRILDLEAELGRTQHELEVLRDTTAQMLAAILTKMEGPVAPDVATDAEIRQLIHLWDASGDDAGSGDATADDPIIVEIEKMQSDNERSLAYLNRRHRWLPGKNKQ